MATDAIASAIIAQLGHTVVLVYPRSRSDVSDNTFTPGCIRPFPTQL